MKHYNKPKNITTKPGGQWCAYCGWNVCAPLPSKKWYDRAMSDLQQTGGITIPGVRASYINKFEPCDCHTYIPGLA